MSTSIAGRSLTQRSRGCERDTYNPDRFLSWAGSLMLGQSRFGAHIAMSATHQNHPKAPVKRGCPDCGAALIKRSSSSCHPLMSSTYLVCKNPVCGATFTGTDEITHRLSPPSNPNPAIVLPYAPSAARRGVLRDLGLSLSSQQQPAQATLEPIEPGARP
ncbi:ogr/Delta-like zinc finger family protein [Pseudomonas sp. Bi70]|uniref:ogr/Delta-like zinc finger family protein n=1 Tax=Pseudomonas sp. Bi70 TaxID=2821127 RepID=UPI001E3BC92D|nr:ogr/Delta-like zinc finger family protein [Pseudomonas sp. Bi70]